MGFYIVLCFWLGYLGAFLAWKIFRGIIFRLIPSKILRYVAYLLIAFLVLWISLTFHLPPLDAWLPAAWSAYLRSDTGFLVRSFCIGAVFGPMFAEAMYQSKLRKQG